MAAKTLQVLDAKHHDPSKQIPVKELVARVVALAQALAEKRFYPYQIEVAFRIVESVLLHDGDVVTAILSRQSGKTETLGAICAALAMVLPELAKKYKNDWKLNITDDKGAYRGFMYGFKIGIYAPRLAQSEIMFDRVKKAFSTDTAKKVLAELKLEMEVSNGNCIVLSNKSKILCESASEQSKIEGATHNLVVAEECVTGDALIETNKGSVRLDAIVASPSSYLAKCRSVEGVAFKKIKSGCSKGVQDIIELKLSNGYSFRCTPNHLVFTPEGWTKAKDCLGKLVDFQGSSQYCHVPYDTTNSRLVRRNSSRRRKHQLSSERLSKCEIHMFTRRATEGLCGLQVANPERVLQLELETCSKQREGNHFSSIHDEMPSSVHSATEEILPKREENSSSRFEAHPSVDSLLVYGRRKPTVGDNRSIPHRGFSEESNSGFIREAKLVLKNKVSSGEGRKVSHNRNSFPIQSNAYEGDSSVHHPFHALQTELDRASKNEVLSLQEEVHCKLSFSEESSESVLLSQLSEAFERNSKPNTRTTSEEDSLRQGAVAVVEIAEVGKAEVFDIEVEEANNFYANGVLVHNCQDIGDMKLRKSIHPMVASTQGTIVKIGTATTRKCDFYTSIKTNQRTELTSGKRNNFCFNYRVCQEHNSLYKKYIEQEKIRLGEDSDEFRTSYECEWIFERGMFVTTEQLFHKDVAVTEGVWSQAWPNGIKAPELRHWSVVAGIDWGRSHDSTVVALVAVDWANPIDTGDFYDAYGNHAFTFYQKHVIDWLEFVGDNYEYQFWEIHEFLQRVSGLKKIVTDSNTCGQPIFDRLASVFSANEIVVEPFNFQPRVKADGYKALYQDICGRRITFPAGSSMRGVLKYRKFVNQMLDLQKTYKGGILTVAHPDEKDALDDYPDAFMLGAWGANVPTNASGIDISETNPFYR